jgi:hypothetical protein
MADVLQDGFGWLGAQLKLCAGHSVTYQRGSVTVEVTAVYGKQLLKVADGRGGLRMEWSDKDFLILAEDLAVDGTRLIPQRGDQIIETIGETETTYEVMAPAGEPPWRWCDPYKTRLRIHTKQTTAEV